MGRFASSDHFNFQSSDYGEKLQRRLTLDSDGNLRLYSRKMEDSKGWVVSWQAKSRMCQIHGLCGVNSYCIYDPTSGVKCMCLSGFRQKKIDDWSYGCESEFDGLLCGNGSDVGFIKLNDVQFYGNDVGFFPNVTLEACEKMCLDNCDCKGFQYGHVGNDPIPKCYPKTLLINGNYDSSFSAHTYLKVSKANLSSREKRTVSKTWYSCSVELEFVTLYRSYRKNKENGTSRTMLWVVSSFGGLEFIGILIVYISSESPKRTPMRTLDAMVLQQTLSEDSLIPS